jgi:hypothetical protein
VRCLATTAKSSKPTAGERVKEAFDISKEHVKAAMKNQGQVRKWSAG